jgi:hypothetical protein
VDTVAFFPSRLGGVWAFSDTDAYLMGYIATGDSPNTVIIGLHWNGSGWGRNINGSPQDIQHFANDVIGDSHFMVSVGYWSIGNEKAGLAEFDNTTRKWKGYQFQTAGDLRTAWTDGKGYFIAVGDNGMAYSKDGYSATWTYMKAPTQFNLYKISGISKTELYVLGEFNTGGTTYPQLWKFKGSTWLKLMDDIDTSGTILKFPDAAHAIGDVGAIRCPYSDSLSLYIIGWESYLLESKGQELSFQITNLSTLGLPLRTLARTGLDINLFTPSDYWVFGTRYNFYHWNGSMFQKVIFPGLPNDDVQFGYQRGMRKLPSGRIFFPSEVSPQVYAVLQGTP